MTGASDSLTVISANRLDTGAAVWLGPGEQWVACFGDALVFDATTVTAAHASAKRSEQAGVVVEAYAVEVVVEANRPRPIRPRERIRSLGPSVRPDLGYQAGPSQ